MVPKDTHPSHHANFGPSPIVTQLQLGAADLIGALHYPPHVVAGPARKVTSKVIVFP